MKNIVLIFLTLVLQIDLKAQTIKILFDATKAETAGNADWVIDADQHNLDWNPGPILNGGDESNAQQFPTPDQSTVISSTAETYWEGSLSAWGIDMVKRGYHVETLPYNGAITYGNTSNAQDLSNYKVFIIDEPNIRFTSVEKTAMLNFVQNGGGLFMISDHTVSDRNGDGWDSPHIWNDFMDTNTVHPFGIHFDYANFSQTTSNVANLPGDPLLHGIMGNVTEVKWSGGTSMTLSTANNASVKGVVFKTGASTTGTTNVLVAYATYGSGRVAAMADSSPADDGTGDPNDQLYNGWIQDASGNHEKIIVNATIWLATEATHVSDYPNIETKMIYIYPNPSSNIVNIDIPKNMNLNSAQIIISDIVGKKVLQLDKITNYSISFSVNQLKEGLYFVHLNEDGVLKDLSKLMIQ